VAPELNRAVVSNTDFEKPAVGMRQHIGAVLDARSSVLTALF
jgi:hypothetical protein